MLRLFALIVIVLLAVRAGMAIASVSASGEDPFTSDGIQAIRDHFIADIQAFTG